MADTNINLDLMQFLEMNILPRYANFDKAHDLSHVMRVIKNSVKLANAIGADVNMAYTIAAYHDLGMSGPRAIHHITGAKILVADARLNKWFNKRQINIMREAVEDHRASTSHSPRSIYGKIIAEADRDLEPEIVFLRAIQYGLSHYPEKKQKEQWERFNSHMENKYSAHGYIKLWIAASNNQEYLNQIRSIIADKVKLRAIFDRLYNEEVLHGGTI